MRRRPISILLLSALLYGGYWFLQRFQIDGLDKVSVKSRTQATFNPSNGDSYVSVPATNPSTVRLATFNIQVFGRASQTSLRSCRCWRKLCEDSTW